MLLTGNYHDFQAEIDKLQILDWYVTVRNIMAHIGPYSLYFHMSICTLSIECSTTGK